jgi:hypothetical protein
MRRASKKRLYGRKRVRKLVSHHGKRSLFLQAVFALFTVSTTLAGRVRRITVYGVVRFAVLFGMSLAYFMFFA